MWGDINRRGMMRGAVAAIAIGWAGAAIAQPQIAADIAARLTPAQMEAYQAYLAARSIFDRRLEMYWALIEERRDHRRRKRAKNLAIEATDYVAEQPPKYTGPPLPPEVAKIVAETRPPVPETPLPVVADYLAAAQAQFQFAPALTTERDFKRRYAIESLNAGLSKIQVTRVYALETGGNGTYDMQSGFDPVTKQGKAISSALGYAQLLAANTVSELVKHGPDFIGRLESMAAQPGAHPQHVAHWRWKADVLRRMLAAAKTVPNEWNAHRRFANTPPGLGIHTLNMDADIGPWLQALKLKGIVQIAAEAGRPNLTGGELEMMNLAGPRSGLELMEPIGRMMPTANLFEQGGYYRNTIVREKTGAELLKALDERMDIAIKRPGAVEFGQAFDEVQAGLPAAPARAARTEPIQPFAGVFDQR